MSAATLWHFASQDLDGPARFAQEVSSTLDEESSRVSLPGIGDSLIDDSSFCGRLDPNRVLMVVPTGRRRRSKMDDRIVAFAKAHGVRVVSVDTDGDCTQLVPVMMEHGINMFFPFEVQAGCDILTFRKNHPTLGIMGGLVNRALAEGKTEIDREVEKAARMVEQGRYIPGFDHLIPPDVSWKNFSYAAAELQKVCYGKRGS
jgi:hypothetical protein